MRLVDRPLSTEEPRESFRDGITIILLFARGEIRPLISRIIGFLELADSHNEIVKSIKKKEHVVHSCNSRETFQRMQGVFFRSERYSFNVPRNLI